MNSNTHIIDQAEAFCAEKKERLTKPRLEVLKIMAESQQPLRAYEILSKLKDVLDLPSPPTVYRAIDFWLQMGFIHRIESLNAYVICHSNHSHPGAQFTICDDCGTVMEVHVDKMMEFIQDRFTRNTFVPVKWNLEIHGQCSSCRLS
ncbi:MAG: transcriptional repressor [Alphaproteobacteria bacterium]|nr:transcriptional repressor [Alphaproteobacteria bacterium]